MIIKLFEFDSPIYVSFQAANDRRVPEIIAQSSALDPVKVIDESVSLTGFSPNQQGIIKLWHFFLRLV